MVSTVEALARSEIFAHADETELQRLAERVETVELPGGEYLLREGDPGGVLYLVVSGRLLATRTRAGGETVLGEIGPGATVGETSLITGNLRSADIRAVRDSLLIAVSQPLFDAHILNSPVTALKIARVAVERSSSEPRRFDPLSTVCLLPAFAGTNVRSVAESLSAGLEEIGSVRIVEESELEGVSGEAAKRRYLEEAEGAYRFVIFCANDTYDDWSGRCMRQADRILMVAEAENTAAHTTGIVEALAQRLDRYRAKRELLVVHRSPPPWDGTADILNRLPVFVVNHARYGHRDDFARIARLLSDTASGLALGGGGTRGIAHLGVLRALNESGYKIDTVAGTSVGAIGASMLAMGMPVEEMRRHVMDIVRGARSLRDAGPPVTSFFSGRAITRALRNVYGLQRFEDLPINCIVVTTSLVTGREVHHRRGPVWWAIRASSSLPGAWPPVSYGGDLLVDGGITNNLPVDMIRHRSRNGVTIASSVSSERDFAEFATRNLSCVSGWSLVARRIGLRVSNLHGSVRRPARENQVPGLLNIMSRVGTLHSASKEQNNEALAGLLFSPPVSDYPLLDADDGQSRRLEEIGYRHAVEVLARMR